MFLNYLRILSTLLIFSILFDMQVIYARACSKNGYQFYFTNGIDVSRTEAEKLLVDIEKPINQTISGANPNQFTLLYSATAGQRRDLIEVKEQILANVLENTRLRYKKIAEEQFLGNMSALTRREADIIEEAFLEARYNTLAQNPGIVGVTQNIAQKMRDETQNGNHVITIGHSQGAIFVNDAYSLAFQDSEIGKPMYHASMLVAKPAPVSNQRTAWFNLAEDRVLNRFGVNYGPNYSIITDQNSLINCLLAEFSLSSNCPDLYIHRLNETYLSSSLRVRKFSNNTITSARQAFINEVSNAIDMLADNCDPYVVRAVDDLKIKTTKGITGVDFEFYVPDDILEQHGRTPENTSIEWAVPGRTFTQNYNRIEVKNVLPSFDPFNPDLLTLVRAHATIRDKVTNVLLAQTYGDAYAGCSGEGCCHSEETTRYVETQNDGMQCIVPPIVTIRDCDASIVLADVNFRVLFSSEPTTITVTTADNRILPYVMFNDNISVFSLGPSVQPDEGASTWSVDIKAKNYWGDEDGARCDYSIGSPPEYIEY